MNLAVSEIKAPTIEEAFKILNESEMMNSGPWVEHSKVAARTAKEIATHCPDLDGETAFVLGLLHDIGRREGWTQLSHTLDGYKYLAQLGFNDAASICLTHSFPIKDVYTYHGEFDCSQDDLQIIVSHLESTTYNDYDRLIQLCDAISLPHGAVVMEKRLVDVVMRHGLPEWTLRKWKSYFELKQYFDQQSKCNIYTLISNIVENTFEW